MSETSYRIFSKAFINDPDEALKEIKRISSSVSEDIDSKLFESVFTDTKRLFEGSYPGYRSSNTKYHDFDHTISVVLATARLIHGCCLDGQRFHTRYILLALVAALFHDVGLIQEISDVKGSGAKYTVGHEDRSIDFARNYLADKHFSDEEIELCAKFIRCTILSLSPTEVDFPSEETKQLGYIVGSADLSAQMADRMYLEKLLLLYKEFEEARLPGFDSELELLKKTKDFYNLVAKKRLLEELDGVCVHMRSHFREWMNVDKDLYNESIEKNIAYLDTLVSLCSNSIMCYLEHLRRGGITKEIVKSLNKK